MSTQRIKLGQIGEEAAVAFLKRQGYHILDRNFRNKLGEIDIIARDKKTLAFVEVKARRSGGYGSPKWAVTPKKQRKISMVALYYLKTTKQNKVKARFDVVAISSSQDNPRIELIKNAFELAYG